ncbi:hypothetical protein [Microbacterium invictum]|uniref:Tyr recombinase domain-containing protein n=1 Tax=Microbacterium invictum TaxID=515415 RepID=A0ABZ0VCH9_9MICO|nr:hypothetical protein [Microbacterium invictum]WQB71338.1 hypothetical protein T9R20_05055 [Microbacterium invictum]
MEQEDDWVLGSLLTPTGQTRFEQKRPLQKGEAARAFAALDRLKGFSGHLLIGGLIDALNSLSEVLEPIQANPVRFAKPPRQAPKVSGDAHYWTRAQVDRFRGVSDSDALAGLFRLSLAGMTRADLHGLMWDDVDMARGLVRVERGRVALQGGATAVDEPKSAARHRTLPIEQVEPGTIAALRSLRAAQAADRLRAGGAWVDSGYVIVDAIGRPEHPERYSERFRRLSAEAGLPPIRLHALRHSLAA